MPIPNTKWISNTVLAIFKQTGSTLERSMVRRDFKPPSLWAIANKLNWTSKWNYDLDIALDLILIVILDVEKGLSQSDVQLGNPSACPCPMDVACAGMAKCLPLDSFPNLDAAIGQFLAGPSRVGLLVGTFAAVFHRGRHDSFFALQTSVWFDELSFLKALLQTKTKIVKLLTLPSWPRIAKPNNVSPNKGNTHLIA